MRLQNIQGVTPIGISFKISNLLSVLVEVLFEADVAEEGGVEGHPVAAHDDPLGGELCAGGAVDGLVVRDGAAARVGGAPQRVRRAQQPHLREQEHVLAVTLVHVHLPRQLFL